MVSSLINYIDTGQEQGGYHREIEETNKNQPNATLSSLRIEIPMITSPCHEARRLQLSDSSSDHPSAVDPDLVHRPFPAQERQTVKMSATSLAHLEAG
jgi:hypothetical protein